MVRISILYPNSKSARFDMPYYIDKHMPMSIALLSGQTGFRGVSVERGMGGAFPRTEPAFVALCHFLFDSLADFAAAFTPHADTLRSDMPNYTDIEPIIQVSEVVLSRQSQIEVPRAGQETLATSDGRNGLREAATGFPVSAETAGPAALTE